MKSGRRRSNTRQKNVEPITVWRALNEPVAEISEGVAKGVFTATAVILLAVWMAPYWGQDSVVSSKVVGSTYLQYTTYNLTTGRVAGAQVVADVPSAPAWYYMIEDVPEDVTAAFGAAANEVLDISDPVSEVAEFYEPGTTAVWDAWLELMVDPY